ncbi:hypothetical protein [Alkaliphilus transvaalensis]|uniref:hypothetical protein n=1 Tax=Alkaliphilus transvaalensis TaxID=114628 RepID=UPI00047D7D89|nr:hypothetical protein [Alkaliphilus transvaalensis]
MKYIENLRFVDMLVLITSLVSLYLLVKEIFRRHFFGKRLISPYRGTGTKGLLIYWVLLGGFWVYLMFDGHGLKGYYDRPYFYSFTPILMILLSIACIIRLFRNGEIRQKGIASRDGMIHWKQIIKYRWIEGGKLEIIYFPINKLFAFWEMTKGIEVNLAYREEIEDLLKQHIG